MDGLTEAERQSYLTFWAINAAPLFVGDDLTKLADSPATVTGRFDQLGIGGNKATVRDIWGN
ncbi:hypothetical protein GCM10009804_40430 [Kribbella hippodromi]|uniref:Uncharacterized protein n=2 Tax=Kribbella hippodromi TaxID=434347 RepID=A0ABP4PG26_9ACTN